MKQRLHFSNNIVERCVSHTFKSHCLLSAIQLHISIQDSRKFQEEQIVQNF